MELCDLVGNESYYVPCCGFAFPLTNSAARGNHVGCSLFREWSHSWCFTHPKWLSRQFLITLCALIYPALLMPLWLGCEMLHCLEKTLSNLGCCGLGEILIAPNNLAMNFRISIKNNRPDSAEAQRQPYLCLCYLHGGGFWWRLRDCVTDFKWYSCWPVSIFRLTTAPSWSLVNYNYPSNSSLLEQ